MIATLLSGNDTTTFRTFAVRRQIWHAHINHHKVVVGAILGLCGLWSLFLTWQGLYHSLLLYNNNNGKEVHEVSIQQALRHASLFPRDPHSRVSPPTNDAKSIVDLYDPTPGQSCWIASPDDQDLLFMNYVGCGYNSQVFAVTMMCQQQQVQDTNNTATTTTTTITQVPIVIKLRTFPANASDTKKFIPGRVGTYKSDTEETVEKQRLLYQRLVLAPRDKDDINNNAALHQKRRILQHFALRLGSVQVPLSMIQRAVASANQRLTSHSPYRSVVFPVAGYNHYPRGGGDSHNNESDRLALRGQVYAHLRDAIMVQDLFATSKHHRNGQQENNLPVRQAIVRDLIFMYRHMFQQRVVVCDVKWPHLIYSNTANHTTMIDFDDFRFFRDNAGGRYNAVWQLWQLLVLLADLCDHAGMQRNVRPSAPAPWRSLLEPSGLASIACGAPGGQADLLTTAESTFAHALQQCQFNNPLQQNSSIPWTTVLWTNRTTIIMQDDDDDVFQHVQDFYDALAAWSGIVTTEKSA